jgi:Uma2 family endonuclease
MPFAAVDEITLPEDKPAWEWINGRRVQKQYGDTSHAVSQGEFCGVLHEWAGDRGMVGVEWSFRVTPPGERTRPLVPDVAYLSYERFLSLDREDRDLPPIAPEIVVEVLSPGDLRHDIDEKIRVYLAFGVRLVLYVDPLNRTIDAYEADGSRVFGPLTTYTPTGFPDLTFDLETMFKELDVVQR